MRYDARADANQAEIVAALREIGATVTDLHRVGGGCPDLLVGYRGVNYLLEVKTEDGEFTPKEADWFLTWHGQRAVVHTIAEALAVLGMPYIGVEP